MRKRPRHPVYVISKGRYDPALALTVRFLLEDEIPFRLVIEPTERDEYAQLVDSETILVLPFADLGLGSIPARNFAWEHAIETGAERHWILDDNIASVERFHGGRRERCPSGPVFACVEDFVDRYENVAITGLNYHMFGIPGSLKKPFHLNAHVYSFMLIDNALEQRWRGRYNEDTDLCLQVLAAGLCTILVNAFLAYKKPTMTGKGGNTDELYAGDGRLEMARSLERRWPGVVKVRRRYGRPQHVVDWKKFDTPLIRKPDVDLSKIEPNEYGLVLR